MNNLQFIRTNGNVPKKLEGKDHISGIIYYMPSGEIPVPFENQNKVHLISSLEAAEKLGIKYTLGNQSDDESWHRSNLHYQLSQIFRINPGVSLYVGIFPKPADNKFTFTEVKRMQNFAGGEIRQLGIWNGTVALTNADLVTLCGVAKQLEAEDAPLSILYVPYIESLSHLQLDFTGIGRERVTVVAGQDSGNKYAASLYSEAGDETVSGLGIVLGLVSKAKVNESISWVGKFPTGVTKPAFGDGTLYCDTDWAIIELLDRRRFVFFRTYGLSDSFVNDSHNMDMPTSDYCTIELVRTMDKAVRGIRTYILPELGAPLDLDPETGKLAPELVKHLETVANYQMADMTKAGELSGWKVSIDPDQNVATTRQIEFAIHNVAVGVLRTGVIKIGWAIKV